MTESIQLATPVAFRLAQITSAECSQLDSAGRSHSVDAECAGSA